jgi:hypothetical protein
MSRENRGDISEVVPRYGEPLVLRRVVQTVAGKENRPEPADETRGLKLSLRRYSIKNMGRKPDADPTASALAQKRWDNTSENAKKQEGKRLAAARWAGHVAKRPASSRKKAVAKKKSAK